MIKIKILFNIYLIILFYKNNYFFNKYLKIKIYYKKNK